MKINDRSHIQLEEGEKFIEEVISSDGINRIITLQLATGRHVLVQRHFSQIGPIIIDIDGIEINTHYDPEAKAVRQAEMSEQYRQRKLDALARRKSQIADTISGEPFYPAPSWWPEARNASVPTVELVDPF